MQEDLISVIAAVYNVEDYLDDCIKSIMNQTYKNIEIILVDDGSTDKSGEICDKYAKQDNRIKSIHQKNSGGPGAPRNKGIKESKGKYIAFIDADDMYCEDYLENLHRLIAENDADISVCNYFKLYSKTIEKDTSEENIKTYTNLEFLKLFNDRTIDYSVVVWNKLYKREIFDDIEFAEGKSHEDEGFSYKAVYKSSKIVVTSKKLYLHYYLNMESEMRAKFGPKRLNAYEFIDDRIKLFKELDMDLYDGAIVHYLLRIRNDYYLAYKADSKDCANFLLKKHNEVYKIFKDRKIKVSSREKFLITLFAYFRPIFILLKDREKKKEINLRKVSTNE